MAKYAPPKCLTCGQYTIKKEIINGVRTGDWICTNCGEEGMLSSEPWPITPPLKADENKE